MICAHQNLLTDDNHFMYHGHYGSYSNPWWIEVFVTMGAILEQTLPEARRCPGWHTSDEDFQKQSQNPPIERDWWRGYSGVWFPATG
jgi:hypothetical protein